MMDDIKPVKPTVQTTAPEPSPEEMPTETSQTEPAVEPTTEPEASTDAARQEPASTETEEMPIEGTSDNMAENATAPESDVPDTVPETAAEEPLHGVPVTAPEPEVGEPKAEEPAVVASAAPAVTSAIKPKRGPMMAVLIIVVLVLLALGVAAYFALVKKDTAKPSASKTSSQTVIAKADPEAASKSADTALNNLNDTKDYNQNIISDTTLGL